MIRFSFNAFCGEQTMPLQVTLPYRPGKQTQRARRVAIGELLAALEIESATIDASGEDQVRISTPQGTWIIAEARAAERGRGRL